MVKETLPAGNGSQWNIIPLTCYEIKLISPTNQLDQKGRMSCTEALGSSSLKANEAIGKAIPTSPGAASPNT